MKERGARKLFPADDPAYLGMLKIFEEEVRRISVPRIYPWRTWLEPPYQNVTELLSRKIIFKKRVPEPWDRNLERMRCLKLWPSSVDEVSPAIIHGLYKHLWNAKHPISLEILGFGGHEQEGQGPKIILHAVVDVEDLLHVRDAFQAHFPNLVCELLDHDPLLEHYRALMGARRGQTERELVFHDYLFERPYYEPLVAHQKTGLAPAGPMVQTLKGLQEHELGFLQLLMVPARHPWQVNMRALLELRQRLKNPTAHYAPAPPVKEFQKVDQTHFFAVAIRAGVICRPARHEALLPGIGGTIHQAASGFYALTWDHHLKAGLTPQQIREIVLLRVSHHTGMILSVPELTSLTPFTTPEVLEESEGHFAHSPSIKLPEEYRREGLIIGTYRLAGKDHDVRLAHHIAQRNLYAVGETRCGKSTVLLHLIIQEVREGHGLGLIDPAGDLAGELLNHIPDSRVEEVAYFFPSGGAFAFNIMELTPGLEDREIEELVSTFRVLLEAKYPYGLGPQMENLLRYGLHTLRHYPQATLFHLRELLLNKTFRTQVISSIKDPRVQGFWRDEFPQIQRSQLASVNAVVNKLSLFTMNEVMKNATCQPRNRLRLKEIMDRSQIFIANLSGLTAEESSDLAAILMAKVHTAALGRSSVALDHRQRFSLYCDEFSNYINKSFPMLLAQAQKFGVALRLAHQNLLGQLPRDIGTIVLGNVGIKLCFSVSANDAQQLSRELISVSPEDLQTADQYTAYLKIQGAETIHIHTLPPPIPEQNVRDQILAASHRRFGAQPVTWADQFPPSSQPLRREDRKGGGDGPLFDTFE